MFCFDRCGFDDEDFVTDTSEEQLKTETKIFQAFTSWRTQLCDNLEMLSQLSDEPSSEENDVPIQPRQPTLNDIVLHRGEAIQSLTMSIKRLPQYATALAQVHMWTVFWIIHSVDLLDATPVPAFIPALSSSGTAGRPITPDQFPESRSNSPFWTPTFGIALLSFISRFQSKRDGGFAGHFGGEGHILTTYAGVLAMVTVAARCNIIHHLFLYINRADLRRFFMSMKITDPNNEHFGAFVNTFEGEIDTRAVYCMTATLDILGMLPDPELVQGTVEWLRKCQTYEGGFAAEPGGEAHGGYTFTALAAFVILESAHEVPDLNKLEKWCAMLQLEREGGFSGRTHKLVDSCYSYWVGSVIPLIHVARNQIQRYHGCFPGGGAAPDSSRSQLRASAMTPPPELGWVFDQGALQQYLLLCCQSQRGLFQDKPGKSPDLYHTCYSLSGLAISQLATPLGKLRHFCLIPAPATPQSATSTDQIHSSDTPVPVADDDDIPELSISRAAEVSDFIASQVQDSRQFNLSATQSTTSFTVLGGRNNLLQPNNILYNISQGAYLVMVKFLKSTQPQQSKPI